MTCEQFRAIISKPEGEYVNVTEASAGSRHVDACPACQQRVFDRLVGSQNTPELNAMIDQAIAEHRAHDPEAT